MKLNIITTSDYSYLPKGLCLYNSLVESDSDFTLHYFCLDRKSYDKLDSLSLKNVEIYDVDLIAEEEPLLKTIRKNDYWFFCMVSASYFMNYLLQRGLEEITYVDSDIYFHKSINKMVELFDDKEVAIFRHRQFPYSEARPEGWFNVGVVHFKNKKFGKKILEWWSDAVLNKKYPELATCGDQKYLDKFPEMCPEDNIYIDGEVGHGAPWQWQVLDLSRYSETGKILFEGQEQELFFTHFSQFSYNIDRDSYVASTMHHTYTPLSAYQSNKELNFIYDEYFKKLKKTIKDYVIT